MAQIELPEIVSDFIKKRKSKKTGGEPVLEIPKHDFIPFASHWDNDTIKTDVNGKILLMAKDDIEIRLNYDDNFIEKEYLSSGEVYFLSQDKDVLISSKSPENVDVFLDEGAGKHLGTLRDFYIFN